MIISQIDFDELGVRFGALFDGDAGFCDVKMFRKKFSQSSVSFAVVRFGAEINRVGIVRIFDDFFLASSGFDGDRDGGHKLFLGFFL